MKGIEIIDGLKRKLDLDTDRALGNCLGMTGHAIHNWKIRKTVTVRQVVSLLNRAIIASAKRTNSTAIRPLVEFFPIKKCPSKGGARYEIFASRHGEGKVTPYLEGLRDELEIKHGVYIFFDSRGQAIYAGKARQQNLWKEIKLAFNRKRGDVQNIRRVRHPGSNRPYRTSDERARQIVDLVVPIHELAAYFSAYEVADGLIGEVEAMLVRSFANDLLNIRMERFDHQRRVRKSKKAK